MTTVQLAQAFNAKRIGRGRYTAKCPAHPDRNPSLSIKEGRQGSLIRCWSAQCEPRAIMESAGLKYADLFYGEMPDPEALRKIEEKRRQAEAIEAAMNRRRRWEREKQRKWAYAAAALRHLHLKYPTHERISDLFWEAIQKCGDIELPLPITERRDPYILWPGFETVRIHGWINNQDVGEEIARYLKL